MTRAFIYTYDDSPKPKPWLPPFVKKPAQSTLGKQLAGCRNLAARKGFRVVGEYGGGYESFNRQHRAQMVRELKRAPGRVEAVIIYTMQDFAMSHRDFIRVADEIEATGAKIYAVLRPALLFHEILKRLHQ